VPEPGPGRPRDRDRDEWPFPTDLGQSVNWLRMSLTPARAPTNATPSGLPHAAADASPQRLRLDTDHERVQRGLAQLVMTVVGLLKDLMERQATRRVEAGTLTDDEVERLGTTFARLEEGFAEILEHLELRDDDLTLDLGPLGPLR
jgi:hypothetical protein